MVAYPVLLISMAYIAYGNSEYSTIEIFSVSVINYDIEENPDSFNMQNASEFFCNSLYEYKDTITVAGNNTHTLTEATGLLNALAIDAILIIGGNFSEAIYSSPGYANEVPKVEIMTKDNIVILAELSGIIVDIVNNLTFGITGAPEAEITSTRIGNTYADYTLFDLLIPGIIIGSLTICLSLLAISIGKEKETRRMHRLMTTPVKKNTLLTSIMITQIIAAVIQYFIAVSLSVLLATRISTNVNWFLIFFIAMLYNLSSMGIGLILGSFVKSGKAAALISFIIAFTMMMVGENYTIPGEMAGSAFIPNTYAVDAVRNIMLFGETSWEALGLDIIFLTLFGIIALTIGLISFNRKYAMK